MRRLLSPLHRLSRTPIFSIALAAAMMPCAIHAAENENEWTWMHGSQFSDGDGTYGTQGIPAPENIPSGRSDTAHAGDPAGNLWLYGGYGRDSTGERGRKDDLWKFDTSSLQWTWFKGSTTNDAQPVRGEVGVPAPANTPGARTGAVLWCDRSGVVWLFGGEGNDSVSETNDSYSDLWRFDPQVGDWTWVKGHPGPFQPPIYGTMGQPDPANTPGARAYASGVTDSSGALWLFGGQYPDATAYNNGLWRFTPNDQNWTWIKGEDLFGLAAHYGIQGVESPANTPGGRSDCTMWADQNGKIWMFGGFGRDAADRYGVMSDLWRLDTSTGNWTWMKGPNLQNYPSTHGPVGVANSAYNPSSRRYSGGWTDASGNLWMFGSSDQNDLWNYSPSTRSWAWVGGSDLSALPPQYGILGVPSPMNIPGARATAAFWIGADGNFWLFGGYGRSLVTGPNFYGPLNDTWRFIPGPVPVPSAASMWAFYE